MVAVAIAVAFIAVVVPTCRMVGCSMSVGSTMPWGYQPMAGLFGDCGGEYLVNATPTAVIPPGLASLFLVLMALVLGAAMLHSPQRQASVARTSRSGPPPPPEDPRGMRLRV